MKKVVILMVLVISSLLLFSCGEEAVDKVTEAAVTDSGEYSGEYLTEGTAAGEFSWSLDTDGVLKITLSDDNKTKEMNAANADYLKAIEPFRDKVTHMEIDRFVNGISYSADQAALAVGDGARNLCASMPSLVSVHFVGDNQNFWVEENGAEISGLFYGASSLKTVWFGEKKTENVVDASAIGYSTPIGKENYLEKSLFSGCSSIEKVILPNQMREVAENTFKGCVGLAEAELGTLIANVAAGAFADCSALKLLNFESEDFTVGENAIPDNEELTVNVKKQSDRLAIKNACTLEAASVIVPIDDYWQTHIDEKIANLPDGKSFIIYTDTHFQSSLGRNTRKTASLIEYVREKTGIKTVINLGDPYTGEKTIEKSDELMKTSVEEYFFDIFGSDGLFAVGNHDANYTTWLGYERATDEKVQVEWENGCGAFNYILPDTNIYNASIKNIEDIVTFDTKLIEKLDRLTYAPVGEEGGVYTTSEGTFPQVYYSAEDMKEQAYAWAKMHYHYDDDEQKIRYIVLDSGDCGLTTKYTLGNALWTAIMPTQFDWLYDTLVSTPDGYDIAVVAHMLSNYTDGSNGNLEIYRILSAFRGGYKISLNANANNDNMRILVGDANKEYDFSNVNFEGNVFTMSGHWHLDRSFVWYTDGKGKYKTNQEYRYTDPLEDDAIFYIGLNNDCLEPNADDGDPVMTKGTDTENSFTIVTLTDDGEIILTRIGAGEDRKFSYFS